MTSVARARYPTSDTLRLKGFTSTSPEMTAPAEPFVDFFIRATGRPPYAYQRALGERTEPPAVLQVHTGAGKTNALIVSWLYARLIRGAAPRRLVYALPMRSLVEQTAEVTCGIRDRLGLDDDTLPVHVLMGGVEPSELRDWRQRPERNQILIGTIDMLLSRTLNRGYAESRFAWPVSFGLLNNDCRWIFDEVQLMGSARATSAQLDGLRAALGTSLPCETIWTSATIDRNALKTIDRPQIGDVVSLPAEDRSGPLRERLQARKTLERLDTSQQDKGELPARIAKTAIENHIGGTRTLVVLNTVELAQATYRELERLRGESGVATVLLHSRFRPPERQEHMERVLAEPLGAGIIVVATQVVEAGVDMSARTLITETAPFSSLVQRLGRCNRAGEYDESTVIWLDRGPVNDDAVGRKAAAPYLPADIELSREALLARESSSLSPATLETIQVRETDDDPAVLRRQDLLDLFDTSPDLSGMDIDIAPFIREDDDRSVTVLFRDISADASGYIREDQPSPERDELVRVPLGSLGKRTCWMVDHVDGGWAKRASREVPPGATVMLRTSDGGYDPEFGWDGKIRESVEPIALTRSETETSLDSDLDTKSSEPEELLPHLAKVAEDAGQLADALGLGQWREVLSCAGALHDLGKAHPVFQTTLRTAIFGDDGSDEDDRLWAKSGKRSGRHERRYFRHELASALAIRCFDGQVQVPQRNLTAYLVAAHHGKVRLSIRPAPDETRPHGAADGSRFALGVVDGDVLPEVETPIGTVPALALDLASMELGADDSWTDAALQLRDDSELGPFRLGFLEALLRIADWRASRA